MSSSASVEEQTAVSQLEVAGLQDGVVFEDDDNDDTKCTQQQETDNNRNRNLVKWPSTKDKLEAIKRRSTLTDDQISSMWLNYQDFISLRENAYQTAQHTKDTGYSRLLSADASSKPEAQVSQMKLDLWAKLENDFNLRGLERHVNSEHRQWRDERSKKARAAVLEAQAAIMQELKEDDEMEDFGEYLAAISLEQSSTSKEFAHMIAKADEKAAKRRSTIQQAKSQRTIRTEKSKRTMSPRRLPSA